MTDQHPIAARTAVVPDALPAALAEPIDADAPVAARIARAASATAAGVHGVHRLGSAVADAASRLRERLGGSAGAPGVRVDAEDGAPVHVDLAIVVEYPEVVTTVADAVRTQVAHAVAQLTSAPSEVRVHVVDVHGPFDREVELADVERTTATPDEELVR